MSGRTPDVRPRVGVLSLQGDFERHAAALEALGAEPVRITRPEHVRDLDALIGPGGESTTMLKLLESTGLRGPIEALARERPVLGTCAGLVLLAREAGSLPAPTLDRLDVTVERNAYGRQVDSFSEPVEAPPLGGRFDAVFIRAPRIRAVGPGVEVIARRDDGEPVAVRAGNAVGIAFHPELPRDLRFHRWFLREVAGLALPGANGSAGGTGEAR